MALTNSYLKSVYETVEKRNPNEPEFQQAVYEVLESLSRSVEARPELEKNGIMERLVEPSVCFSSVFRGLTMRARFALNRGFRVQFNSAIGPYKAACVCIPLLTLLLSSSTALSSASRTA